jgi:hypothetical protein
MSFRRVGGLNYSSKHNYVSSFNNATGNLLISENVGLPNTCIHFESNIDASFCGPTGPTGSSSSSGSSASSGAPGLIGPTGSAGPTGASGNIQSTIVNQTLRPVTILPTPGTLPTPFMEDHLIIPSAGTWLIIGNFNITYNIPYPATSTTTHGFWVSAFNLNYSDYQQLSAYSLAGGGGGLQRLFSVSSVYTTAAPITLGGYCGVVYSQYGATLSGNLTAVKIA